MKSLLIALGALTLTGCAAVQTEVAEVQRDYAEWNGDVTGRAFAAGPVSVVPVRHGELTGFTLVACGLNRVCLGDTHGRRGAVSRDGQATVVRGIHRGHVYYLQPGGWGYVRVHDGTTVPLAWD